MPQPTRRNGRLSACEPCRKAKIRCDHGVPVCGRCDRHGLACVYHPAPMTGSRAAPKKLGSGSLAPSPTAHNPSPSWREGTRLQPSQPQNPRPEAPIASPDITASPKDGLFKRPVTTFGTTKFSAVFSENQASFADAFSHAVANHAQKSLSISTVLDKVSNTASITPDRLRLGIEILRNFPTSRTCKLLIQKFANISDIWVSPQMILNCISQIWSEYGDTLQDSRSTESLSQMATDIFVNSKQPFQLAKSTEWLNWFGGPKLRWEMMGVLFSSLGMMFINVQEWSEVLGLPEQQGRSRQAAAKRMRECADACLKLCEDSGDNEILVVALKNSWKLDSTLMGDESDQIRQGCGIVTSSFLTVGLHRLPEPENVTPLSEYQASLSASLYHLDKVESIFNARPPHLSRHYCTFRWPLDLSEEQLYGGTEKLAEAVSKLDSNGWNTDGGIYSATLLRARCTMTEFWEELLEMTLGINPQVSVNYIDKMLARVDKLESSWPLQIQYGKIHDLPDRNTTRPAHEVYAVTRVHLDVLRCKFLFQRLKSSRFQTSSQPLNQVAQETMDIVISFWLNRDHWSQYAAAFDWIVVCYGIPCAGVLCIELLKSAKPQTIPSTAYLPRSELIQSLTMFIGFLGWIRPTDGNHDLCKKLQRVIKRIVDTVLDTNLPSQSRRQAQTPPDIPDFQSNGNFTLDPMLLPLENMDDLTWLNTIDWTQSDWLDFNQPANVAA